LDFKIKNFSISSLMVGQLYNQTKEEGSESFYSNYSKALSESPSVL
tara:strand:+ start:393 stop:530 length:138 start_codon:yes stop_codon:yes gene_type:complete